MVEHYRKLSRQAEERRARAVWRRKRFALSLERVQLMEKDREDWSNLMNNSDAVPSHHGEKEDELSVSNQDKSTETRSKAGMDELPSPSEKPILSAAEDARLSNAQQSVSLTSPVTQAASATAVHKPDSSDVTPLVTIENSSVVKVRVEKLKDYESEAVSNYWSTGDAPITKHFL